MGSAGILPVVAGILPGTKLRAMGRTDPSPVLLHSGAPGRMPALPFSFVLRAVRFRTARF